MTIVKLEKGGVVLKTVGSDKKAEMIPIYRGLYCG